MGMSAQAMVGLRNKNQKAEQDVSSNHQEPPCFHDFPYLQHQPRDPRPPPLLVVDVLIDRFATLSCQSSANALQLLQPPNFMN